VQVSRHRLSFLSAVTGAIEDRAVVDVCNSCKRVVGALLHSKGDPFSFVQTMAYEGAKKTYLKSGK